MGLPHGIGPTGPRLCSGDAELHVGGRMEMQFYNSGLSENPDDPPPEKYRDMPERMSFSETVTVCDPPHLFSHTWDFDGASSEVCYELETQDGKVLLTLIHRGLKTRDEQVSVCGGWHTHLDILKDVLSNCEPRAFWKRHTGLEAEYENLLPGP